MFLFPPLSKGEIETRWLQLRCVAETAMGLDLPEEVEFKKLMGLVIDPAGNVALIMAKKRSYGAYEVMFTFAAELVKAQSGARPAAAGRKNRVVPDRRSLSRPESDSLPPPMPKAGPVKPKKQNALRRAWGYILGEPERQELAARRRAQWLHARRTGSRLEKFIHFYFRDRRNRHLYFMYNLKATIFLLVLLSLCICPVILAGALDSLAR